MRSHRSCQFFACGTLFLQRTQPTGLGECRELYAPRTVGVASVVWHSWHSTATLADVVMSIGPSDLLLTLDALSAEATNTVVWDVIRRYIRSYKVPEHVFCTQYSLKSGTVGWGSTLGLELDAKG